MIPNRIDSQCGSSLRRSMQAKWAGAVADALACHQHTGALPMTSRWSVCLQQEIQTPRLTSPRPSPTLPGPPGTHPGGRPSSGRGSEGSLTTCASDRVPGPQKQDSCLPCPQNQLPGSDPVFSWRSLRTCWLGKQATGQVRSHVSWQGRLSLSGMET